MHPLPRSTVALTLAAAAAFSLAGNSVCLAQHQQPAPYTKPLPVRPNLPGTLSDEVGLRTSPPLAREGTFLSNARGQAVKGKSGRWFFIFDPDAAGRTLPPMVLLPNQNLAAIDRQADRTAEGTRLAITGQVTVYQGLNYLLATAPPLVIRASEPATAPRSGADVAEPAAPSAAAPADTGVAPATTAETAAPKKSSDEPSIDDVVAQLDKAAGKVAATSPQRATVAVDPTQGVRTADTGETTARALVAPGMLVSRRGRIARAADGAMVFMFDSGVDGGAPSPLVLLPCQNLTAIEQIGERSGEAATYTVSGEIMTYRGRNYLLVRSYRANRTGDQLMPAQ